MFRLEKLQRTHDTQNKQERRGWVLLSCPSAVPTNFQLFFAHFYSHPLAMCCLMTTPSGQPLLSLVINHTYGFGNMSQSGGYKLMVSGVYYKLTFNFGRLNI